MDNDLRTVPPSYRQIMLSPEVGVEGSPLPMRLAAVVVQTDAKDRNRSETMPFAPYC